MLLLNIGLFITGLIVIFFLYRYLKSIKILNKSIQCNFRISKVKYYQSVDNRKFAKFSVHIKKMNTFFVDFPISFKFYSDQRFNSRIKISYSTLNDEDSEEILNKIIQFETKTKEYKYYINDIIVGKIDIEIELLIDYGDPIIEFEILKNNLCILNKEYKKIIKFPK